MRRLNARKLQAMCDAQDARELHAELARALSVLSPEEAELPRQCCLAWPRDCGKIITAAMSGTTRKADLRRVLLELPARLKVNTALGIRDFSYTAVVRTPW